MNTGNETSHAIPKKKEGFEGQRTCILPQAKRKICVKHVLLKNLYITDIGYYPKAAFHNRERKNGSQQYILIYCVKGEGWYKINDKVHLVKANQYFIIPVGILHEYGADMNNPWSIYWVHFTGELAPYYFSLLFNTNELDPVTPTVNSSRLLLFDDIIQHLELMNNLDNIVYSCSCLYALLSSFQLSEIKVSVNDNDIVQRCIHFMKNNLDKNLLLKDLSDAVGLSASHLSTLFKKRLKYSPVHLFTSYKIQKACQLLMDSQHNIKTVAYSLGYTDQYHFSRLFKNVMGVSPKNFKKR